MDNLQGLVFIVVIVTSIWVWADARSKAKNSVDGKVGGEKPWAWFWGCLLLWIILFPLYLVRRGQGSKRVTESSPVAPTKPLLGVLEQERLLSQQEAERAECLQRVQALEERYKQTRDETLVPRIQALRAAAETVKAVPERDRGREELQTNWESRTPADLLEEARVLAERYKNTHDEALVPRIQALRRTAREREKPTALAAPSPLTIRKERTSRQVTGLSGRLPSGSLIVFLVTIVIVALMIKGGLFSPNILTDGSHAIKYVVTGTVRGASLTYVNESGGTEQRTVSVPLTLEFRRAPGTSVYLSAQKQEEYGSVHVSIYVDGALLQEAESNEEYGIATASALVP
jgi:hypothetical protein